MKCKFFAILATAFVLMILISLPAQARRPEDFLIRNYSISLAVECIISATEAMANLPGATINSSIDTVNGFGSMDRRVSNLDLESALAALQAMGQLQSSNTNSQNVFAVMTDVESQLEVRSNEYDRLMTLLYEVEGFNNFNTIENRLVNVIGDMEHLQGRLKHLNFETSTSRISIWITQLPEEEEEPEVYGAFARIGRAFSNSAKATLDVFQGILVVLAYASIPLTALIIFGMCVFVIIRRLIKKGKVGVAHNEDQTQKPQIEDNNNQ